MTESLSHRGPDDQGFFVNQDIGLGHRRLSVIDLNTGHQPIHNEDQSVWLIFNGEIYNFQALRKKLIQQGHHFYTQTDTEVIVHLYEEKQEDFLKDLNGMFALALWDNHRQGLILARDRLGQKPIYYTIANNSLIFGSELKALLKHPMVKKELDYQSLAKYLLYEYVPAPKTIFKDIYKLEPAQYLIFKRGQAKIRNYWQISFQHYPQNLSQSEYLSQLANKFEAAVAKRLITDVPLGVFLSGGLDSTAIAYLAQKNSSQRIKTFSIGFLDKSFDESEYIQQAVGFLKSDHYQTIIRPCDCLELIPQITEFLDEPLADGSIIPTYLLAKFTKEKVKVALSGDGGDELFMGYPTFQAHRLAQFLSLICKTKVFKKIVSALPVSFNNLSFDFRLKKFTEGIDYAQPEIRQQIWLGAFPPVQLSNILTQQIHQQINPEDIFQNIGEAPAGCQRDADKRLIYLYLKTYLQDDILTKTDRASMAVGLEVRAPFLDYTLVDFINAIPSKYKLRGWTTKYLFKKLMQDKLPKNIVYRPKKGFGIPIAKWISNELKDFTLDLFNQQRIRQDGIFNYTYIKQLLQEHFSGKKDNRKLLWTLMVFQMWLNKWS